MSAHPLLHVAIIMDGNGRWAVRRGLPRLEGHRRGADAVDRVVQAAPDLGIGTLTLYAFSSDNWRRPDEETAGLMRLFQVYLRKETARCLDNGVRLTVIGRRDRLPGKLVEAIAEAERITSVGKTLNLRLAVDYSARDAILRAAELHGQRDAAAGLTAPSSGQDLSRGRFAGLLARAIHAPEATADVDLLVRTGGEQRLSDFLLWECAYAELSFSAQLWPDFTPADLAAALSEFRTRQRRFGALAPPAPAA
jgi:undecaprenyl diphosphate synthase